MTGFLVHARDPAAILYALRDLCAGHEPVGESAQRVRLTLHKADGTVGGHGLSPREQEVLCGLSKGLSYKMIANELHISFETVRSHVKGIYLKMDVKNNTAAVAKAIHCGLVAG
ncbi:MAG TPA: response regulator transcription factor [Flavobacteriales bacterium]|nr:response regulator transcription factor [Flavobacteriales bacterium]